MRDIRIDKEYIRVIDDLIPPEVCERLIQAFQSTKPLHREVPGQMVELDLLRLLQDPELEVAEGLRQEIAEITDQIMRTILEEWRQYQQTWDPDDMMPPFGAWGAEGMRIKQYRVGEHEFRLHTDVGHRDSTERFLAFLLYLNDPGPQAGTSFPRQEVYVEPRQGSLMIFPPLWMFPHEGLMPQVRDKYILSTYLRYTQ